MSQITRPKAPVRNVLARILDEPALVAEVRALSPAALTKVIEEIGLEDAGEVVALATTEQIERVFDADLWTRAAPGEDETFDADRFVTWLEILLEAGDTVAARRLAELDVDVITLAFHRLVHVIDTDAIAMEIAEGMHDDGEAIGPAGQAIERAIEDAQSHEIGAYMVLARSHRGWDAIVHALVALDEVDHAACARLLERLAAMTEGAADEAGGLSEVLTAEESLLDDVRGDRDDRRAKEGFVSAADARAFLRLARETDVEGEDAIAKAYFRDLDRTTTPPPPTKLESLLPKAKKPRALPRRPTRFVPETPEALEELAFLVNVLLGGDSRPWRPAEAAEAVVAVLEQHADLAKEKGIIPAFRAGVRAGTLDAVAGHRRQ